MTGPPTGDGADRVAGLLLPALRWNAATRQYDCEGATIDEAAKVLARLTREDLLATWNIQGYTVTGLAAVYQVVEHFGLHYGQIVYITKMQEGRDLGFYKELGKTGRATGGSV